MNHQENIEQLKEIAQGIAERNKWAEFYAKKDTEIALGDYFLVSPDSENYQLYNQLLANGWKSLGMRASYLWEVQKGATLVRFIEGDIYVENLVDDELKAVNHLEN